MVIYGRNVAEEFLKYNSKSIKKVIIQEGFSDEKLISLIKKSNFKPIFKNKHDMDNLANGVHQGIILDVMDYIYYNFDEFLKGDSSFVLIVDHLEDPHNLGAIIRTSEAAGVDAIIIPQDREVQINATVMKTSAGALSHLKVCRVNNLVQAIDKLKKQGYWIVGTVMDGDDFKTVDYSGKIGLVIGNEGNGISRLVRESCDFNVTIPMYGKVNSLNASVAAGIMIYEVVRNRK